MFLYSKAKRFFMHKIFINILIFHSLLFSAYNPFFEEIKPIPSPKKQEVAPIINTIIKHEIHSTTPDRTKISLQYFGFLESKKGKFALVNFNGKTIILKQEDSLYLGVNTYKIKKIHSNYLLVEDSYKRVQSVYFSTASK